MAVPFDIATLLGENGAYVLDLAFGNGPQQDLGAITGTYTFNPNSILGGGAAGVGVMTFTPSGNLTGAIISAGVRERQKLVLINEHATRTVTFDVVGTSNVTGGTGVVIPAAAAIIFIWNNHTSTWLPLITASLNVAGVTATAAEINVLHNVTPGTAAASSAVVLGAAKDLDTLKIDGSLVLASAASVAYAATMALVVATPVITVAAANGTSATATINCAAVAPAGATLTIVTTTDSSGTCTVTFGTHFKVTGTQATTLSKVSTISFVGDGTNWNEVGRATAM